MLKNSVAIFVSLLSVVVGLSLGLALTLLAGEDPFQVLQVLIQSCFGSRYDLGMTLFYAGPILLTGLSVAYGLKAGLFNIGAEGQLTMGALFCLLGSLLINQLLPGLPVPLQLLFCVLSSFVGGALWGAVAGWLKAWRGSHEVISTIMLNFIAAGLCNYVVLYHLRNMETQNPESIPVPKDLISPTWITWDFFEGAPTSIYLLIGPLLALFLEFFFRKTLFGYKIRMTGANPEAAQINGIEKRPQLFWAMAISGGLAGLVGPIEILGNAGTFRLGFSPGFGFLGIAVALLARGNPVSVIFSALLFGALQKGTTDLDFETENITKEFSLILQALIILCVSARGFWSKVEAKCVDKLSKGAVK